MRIHKRFLFVICICASFSQTQAQSAAIDTIAVSIPDRMSDMIGSLTSCSVTITSNYDIRSEHLGLEKHSNEEYVYMQGPDKLLIRSEGDIYPGTTRIESKEFFHIAGTTKDKSFQLARSANSTGFKQM